MLTVTEAGVYCAAAGCYIDPTRAVDRALITHAHSDHARPGSRAYLCAQPGVDVLRLRVGPSPALQGIPYGEPIDLGGVRVSFHPAGHVLGSAQIRLEHRGEVWVVSGDYKLQADPTCAAFEPVPCHTFVTECTFGLPIYRWPEPATVFASINEWWRGAQAAGRTGVVFAYSLGKAQRILAGVDPAVGPLLVHDAVHAFLPAYAAAGVALPPTERATPERLRANRGRALLVAPPMAGRGEWWEHAGEVALAQASGWMRVRSRRRQRGGGPGFVLSDHADWPGLISAIRATGASRVLVTHGQGEPLVQWLNQRGWEASTFGSLPASDGQAGEDDEEGPV